MIVTVAKSELARLIERPCKLAQKQKESYLACVKLSVDGSGRLVAEATDLNDSVRSVCGAAMVSEDGELLVSARMLSKVVKALPDKPVDLTGEGRTVNIACGRSTFDVPSLDPDDFPGLMSPGEVFSVTVESASLASLAAHTIYAAKREKEGETVSKKLIMDCVNLKCADGTIRATATDSYRIARSSIPAPDAPDFEMNVPVRMISDFAKTAGASVTLFGSDATVGLSSDEDAVVGRAYAGNFPNCDGIIAIEPTTRAEVDRGALLDALKRAAVIDGSDPVILALDDGGINVSRKSDVESMSELVDAKVSAPVVAALNAVYAVDAVSNIPSAEVVLEIQDPIKPLRFSGGGCTAIVMPVRMTNG